MSDVIRFRIDETEELRQHFLDEGYVVVKDAIPQKMIDVFLEEYRSIRYNKAFVYYAQSTHIATRPKLTPQGFIWESMQNASRLKFFKKFCSRFQAVIYADNIAKALTAISGQDKHISWQNMFFDRSTGTVEHQDSWYLDTEPAGNLVGVWYALEDIQKESGPFFVMPRSHKIGLIDRKNYSDHDDFVVKVKDIIKESKFEKKEMLLMKGDILLWHPFLIHGALGCNDPLLSRKSFTSHFYPENFKAKDTEAGKILSIYDHKNPRPTSNPKILSAFRMNDYLYNILVYGLYVKCKFTNITKATSMRREDYE